jgi:hypothetical protein
MFNVNGQRLSKIFIEALQIPFSRSFGDETEPHQVQHASIRTNTIRGTAQ